MKRLRRTSWRDGLALCLLVVGLQQVGSAGYIQAKASLAQILIARAWSNTLDAGGAPTKPWPWADTWPVARLNVPGHFVDMFVLSGASGNALAFGPGFEIASAKLGSPGISLIGGHRDTHFAFLKNLKNNESIQLQLPDGQQLIYRVSRTWVVDVSRDAPPEKTGDESELLLVTCFPFESLMVGGDLRYVVSASPISKLAGAYVL